MTTTKMILACTTALIGGICHASAIVDTFDYGSINQSLVGLGGGGNGWGGSWTGDTTRVGYTNKPSLTYSATGYNNALNPSGSNGLAIQVDNSNAGVIVERTLSTSLGGTVWASVLMRTNGLDVATDKNGAVLWFGGDNNGILLGSLGVGLREGEKAYARYNGTNNLPLISQGGNLDSQGNVMEIDEVVLVLTRISLNHSGTNDLAEVWFNPDLSNGSSGLGTPKFSLDTANILGDSINRIGVSFQRDGSGTAFAEIDAVRVSNTAGEQGFLDVTAIPELSTLSLLGMSLLVLVFQLRHRRN